MRRVTLLALPLALLIMTPQARYYWRQHVSQQKPLSYELEFVDPAPPAATREQRVWFWLHERRHLIKAAAARYHIDPMAIAGVIAWEALFNPNDKKPGWYAILQWFKHEGPGKVLAVDIHPGQNAAIFLEGNPRYSPTLPVPACPWYEPLTLCRINKLRTTQGSIEYIAAIMGAYSTEARLAGYGGINGRMWESRIDDYPEVLATFFNGVRGADLPHAAQWFERRKRTRGFAPFVRSSYAGLFIVNNETFLATALDIPDYEWARELKPRVLKEFKRIAAGKWEEPKPWFHYLADPCSII